MDNIHHNNRLVMKLTKNLYVQGENLVLSPFSLTTAIGMLLAGADDHTQIELIQFLFGTTSSNQSSKNDYQIMLENHASKLQTFIKTNESVLNNANMLYSHKDFPLRDSYVKLLAEKFLAIAKQLNFLDQSASVSEINEDVRKATKDMIPKLLNQIDPATQVILINAIYFKGLWKYPFEKFATFDGEFNKSNGQNVKVKMMTHKKKFPYYRCTEIGIQALRIPYESGSISMVIILPDKEKTISNILKATQNGEKLSQILNGLTSRSEVRLQLPKFKIESMHQLVPHLVDMNVKSIFSDSANLSGISDQKLFVFDIIQKAVIEVDEEGTRAAAATAIVMMRCCIDFDVIDFIVNRPFIYLLVSDDSEHILFSGICEHPNSE